MLIFPLISLAERKILKFELSCEITSEVGTEIDQGKANNFTGFSDNKGVGDTASILFNLDVQEEVYILNISNEFAYGAQSINIRSYSDEVKTNKDKNNPVFRVPSKSRNIKKFFNELILTKDMIIGSSDAYFIDLVRYYKDDWQLIYYTFISKKYSFREAYVLTANCMSMPNEYTQMLEMLLDHRANK